MDTIKVGSSKPKSLLIRCFEIIIVAAIYYSTARLGQTLAIPPGNITPVWIPSGVMLAAVLIRGYHIWPGIFLGAFVGNVWAYIDFSSFPIILKCFFTGSMNGIGDVLSTAGAAYIIEKTTGTKNPFKRSSHIIKFILFGVIAGPAISAVFGVTSLCIVEIIQWNNYLYTLITWWTGDGVGALIIAPALIVWILDVKKKTWKTHVFENSLFWVILLVTAAYCLQLIPIKMIFHLPMFSLAPILIWSSFRLGQRVTFLAVFFISTITIVVTAAGQGPFSGKALNVSLTELQWFIAVMSITIFIMGGVINELFSSMNALQDAHNKLELRVNLRTTDLFDTNKKLEREITERKKGEKKIKSALIEKEVLLRELYHRTKNNMQTIIAMINLQTQNIENETVLGIFKETNNRINSMVLVHEKLYQTKNLSRINLKDYFIDLVALIADSYQNISKSIKITTDMDRIMVSIDSAIPCGLIMNELISNAFKHAFLDVQQGEINISLKMLDDQKIEFVVGDNGIGLSDDLDIRTVDTMGLKSIVALAEHQLPGSAKVVINNGTKFHITFKESSDKERA